MKAYNEYIKLPLKKPYISEIAFINTNNSILKKELFYKSTLPTVQ